jgi:hypothetical protein
MEPDAEKAKRIAALREEMDAIHHANSLYWKKGQSQTAEERAEYHLRQERLEEIRRELAGLLSRS